MRRAATSLMRWAARIACEVLAPRLRGQWHAAADLLWPPVCPHCGERAARAHEHFCESCWRSLRPLKLAERSWSVVAADDASVMAHAAFAVDALFLDILTTSKYRRFRRVGRRLAEEAASVLAGHVPGGTLVPVPLRPDKQRERGFNQTEDFARALAARDDREVAPSWLARRRGGPALAGLPREARERAVRGAFAVTARFPGAASGSVVLVDDVVTTGSTVTACVAALTQGGATQVSVVAMGRAFASADAGPRSLAMLGRF